MLESIHIQGFKGFKDTHIGPLRKVNLVVGGQNVGKTSLLEAVYAPTHRTSFIGAVFRGNGNPSSDGDLRRFRDMTFGSTFNSIELHFGANEGRVRIQKDGYVVNPFLPGGHDNDLVYFGVQPKLKSNRYMNALSVPIHLPNQFEQINLFGKVILRRKKLQLLSLLREIEPRLQDVNAISPDDENRIYAELSDVPVALPLHQLGHGFSRLFYLYANLLSTDSQLALIDEVENGIHYSALPVLMQGIKNVAKERDVQTIMTTHSMDCIKAASKVFEDSPEDFQVIRLVRTEDNIEADMIPGDAVQAVIEADGEVR